MPGKSSHVAVACAAIAIVFTYALQQITYVMALHAQMRAGGTNLEIDPHLLSVRLIAILAALAVVQCFALVLLARAHALRSSLAVGAMLTVISLNIPMTSGDVYAYTGYGLQPSYRQAYAPVSTPPPPAFEAVTKEWGLPMVPCVYGPLWLAVDRVLLTGVTDMSQASVRLRAEGVVSWALLLGLFLRSPRLRRFAPLVAANPAIATLYVDNAHNDLPGVVLLFAAAISVRRQVAVAAIFAACAVAWKISLGAFILCLWPKRDVWRPYAFALVANALGLAGSYLAAGPVYFSALHSVGNENTKFGAIGAAHALLVAAAFVALLLVAVRPIPRWTTWLPLTLAARLYPHYLVWSLPLAARTRAMRLFLVLWPIPAVTVGFASPLIGYGVLAVLVIGVATRDVLMQRRGPALRPS